MANEHYHELIWDYLYGLLDLPEVERLRVHVENCQDCRSALTEAEDQRKMLAQAARAVREVPVFNLPGEDLQPAAVASEKETPPATIAMPMSPRSPSAWRRVWPVYAAAVLLAVAFGIYSAYRMELTTYETEVAHAKGEVEVLEAMFTTLTVNLERDKQAKVQQVKEQFPPQLQATGPGQIRLDTPTNFTIALRDPTGQFQPGTVNTQVLDAKTNALLYSEEKTVSGEGTIQVPGFKTDAKAARVEILAKVNKQEAKIEATLPVSEPSHASHLALDKSLYYAGDVVFFRALTLDRFSLKPPSQPLLLRFTLHDANGRPVKELSRKTGPGGISGGELAITPDLPGGMYTLTVTTAPGMKTTLLPAHRKLEIVRNDTPLAQTAPVVPSQKVIDFLPESGDLIAGVSNRVYYQVRTAQGETTDPGGNVIILAGRQVLYNSGANRGTGVFTFTPDPTEIYSAQIVGPQGAIDFSNPFQKLGIKPDGVVLHALESVGKEGAPIHLEVRNQGITRRILLQITCRGELVGQQCLDVPPGSHKVTLQPTPDAAGVLRVTALDASADALVPLAERLLFWEPTRHIKIAAEITNGAGPFPPGTNIDLKLKTTDEKNNPSAAWMLAAVVNEKVRAKKESGLAEYFYLSGDFGEESIENAAIVLKDSPEARQALDLFLGTHGWRRFIRAETLLASNTKGSPAPDVAFVSLQNGIPYNLKDVYESTLQKEIAEVVTHANQELALLSDQKMVKKQLWDLAVQELVDFQQKPGDYFRLGLGILALLLLLVGALLLVLGLIFLLQKGSGPRSCFAGAFSCLLVCLLLYMVRMPQRGPAHLDSLALAPWPNEFSADNARTPSSAQPGTEKLKVAAASAPLGYFVAQSAPEGKSKEAIAARAMPQPAKAGDAFAKMSEPVFAQPQASSNVQMQNAAPSDQQRLRQESMQANAEMQRRFETAAALAKKPALPTAPMVGGFGGGAPGGAGGIGGAGGKGGKGGAGAGKGGGGFGAAKKAEDSKSEIYFREYAHRNVLQPGRLDLQDTLLWHPNLYAQNGDAEVSFDLSQIQTTYRILIYANSPDGRLGFYEGTINVHPPK
jgi:Putative zinc-finger